MEAVQRAVAFCLTLWPQDLNNPLEAQNPPGDDWCPLGMQTCCLPNTTNYLSHSF